MRDGRPASLKNNASAEKPVELVKKIKETEKKVEDAMDKDESKTGPNVPLEAVTKLQENQFHIIEALESIQDKLQIKPIDPNAVTMDHQRGFETRLGDQLSTLR